MDQQALKSLLEEYQCQEEHSWAPQFQSGVNAIHALGHCLNVTSNPKAALVPVNVGTTTLAAGEDRLPVQVVECAHVGLDTFTETQINMANVEAKAEKLMSTSGPISNIVSYLHKKSTPRVIRSIKLEERILAENVADMRTNLKVIEEHWVKWEKIVRILEKGSQTQQMLVATKGQEISESLKENKLKLDESQKELNDLQSRLQDLGDQQRQAEMQYQQSLDKHGGNKDGWFTTWLKLKSIRKELNMTQIRFESTQSQCIKQKQAILDIQIKELRLKANESSLKDDLERLEQIRLALAYACGYLQCVIASVKSFIDFFKRLASKVENLKDDLDRLQNSNTHDEPEMEEEELLDVRKEAVKLAVKLRCDFYVIGSTAHTYGVISNTIYLPGMQYIYGIGTTLTGDINQQQLAQEQKLREFLSQGFADANRICSTREVEIRQKLLPMAEQINTSTTL